MKTRIEAFIEMMRHKPYRTVVNVEGYLNVQEIQSCWWEPTLLATGVLVHRELGTTHMASNNPLGFVPHIILFQTGNFRILYLPSSTTMIDPFMSAPDDSRKT